jgi:hypothetical protein
MKSDKLIMSSDSTPNADIDDNLYIDVYGNKKRNIEGSIFQVLKVEPHALTKAINLWNYYKRTDKNKSMKQRDFYNKLSDLYGGPVKLRGVYYYKGIVLL